jgi:hypothetical protein
VAHRDSLQPAAMPMHAHLSETNRGVDQ